MISFTCHVTIVKEKCYIGWNSEMQDEQKLRGVLKFANACGAITTTKKGAIPALPNEAEALTLFKGK